MVSKDSTDMILDLLYDELSPEESLRAHKLIAQNDDLKAEFNRLQETRDEVRAGLNTSLPAQEVPTSVHDSIMAAAAAHLQSANPQNITPQLAPRTKTSVWTHLARTSRSQFVAVATVAALLLTSAILWRQMQYADAPSSFANASHEQTGAVAFDSDTTSPAPESQIVAAELAEKAKANEPYEFEAPSRKAESAIEESSAQEEITGGLRDQMINSGRVRSAAKPAPTTQAPINRPVAKAKAAPAKKGRSMFSPSYDSDFDSFASENREPSARASSGAQPRAAADSNSQTLNKADAEAPRAESRSASAPRSAESAKSAKIAAPVQSEKAEQIAETNPAITLQSAETALTNRNFTAAIANAESVLTNTQSGPTSRARALHIQALAYTQQRNTKQADETYKTLQTNYPTYRNSEIARARTALNPNPASTKPAATDQTQTVPTRAD